jgi:SprT protein
MSDVPGPLEGSSATHQALTWAKGVVREACARLGEPALASRVRVEMNGRFTRRLGDARARPPTIRLSAPLWPRATEEERRATVVHELCHVVAEMRHGKGVASHGAQWQALMLALGERPVRTHDVDRSGLARRMRRVPAACACADRVHRLSALRVGRMRRGWRYECRACGHALHVLLGERL